MLQKQSQVFHTFLVAFFTSLKQNFIANRSYKVSSHPDCIFEIHQLWQSGFSRVYSNCCCSCSFKPEIIKIGQSSHKMYSNNILNFQKSTTILNACTKKSGNLLNATCMQTSNNCIIKKWLTSHKTSSFSTNQLFFFFNIPPPLKNKLSVSSVILKTQILKDQIKTL